MIVHGFIGEYRASYSLPSFIPELLISGGVHLIKVGHEMKETLQKTNIKGVHQLLSIFYDYDVSASFEIMSLNIANDKRDLFTKVVLNSMKKELESKVIITDSVNNFTSINIDNQDKTIIKILTNFNFSELGSSSTKYLNHFYSNCEIVIYKFNFVKPSNWIETIMTYPQYLEQEYLWSSLVLVLAKFYNDGYTRIRAIIPYVASKDIKIFINPYSSFYIQCNVVSKRKKIAIKYSYLSSLGTYAVDAIRAYLSYSKNFDDIYKDEINFPHIFKIGQGISINDRLLGNKYTILRYGLSIDMYNAHDSRSYLHNLLVVLITNNYIADVIDETGQSHEIKTIQLVLSYNRTNEYKLFEKNIFRYKLHMKKTIEQMINNSVILIRLVPEPIACIIPKQ